MTYDYCGPWCSITGLNAPLHPDPSAPAAQSQHAQSITMQRFLDAGVPAKKLTMGLAWYGRGFRAASTNNDGLYQASQGADTTGFAEVGWSQLRSQILRSSPVTPVTGWRRTFRDAPVCPTLFNAGTRSLIAYDDPETTIRKSAWAKQRGFGGVMVWSLDMDVNREMLAATISPWK